MPVPITDDQAAALQAKVAKLLTDKQSADTATATSNAAGSALVKAQQDAATAIAKAQQDASDASTAEATADGVVNADIAALLAFVQGLGVTVTPPAPAPAPSPAPAPAAT